ncbi:lytic transglycosylase domain-containing protein [Burkholderia cenocepacia]|uniref:lytic transglycosylase domain-containing protein n=1 Tax=Burkholderia cenocepacia TaxID=95486 RepID=UPI0013DEDB82|nr:lytic transglycosylase domain-containing protein [Burkholderia cenocepacia]MCW3587382.1 lytic transglycosylase domain-containing protein [Burkholderia cenocepacia]MCW3632586.1 lytic transglycosylase domain-containing protein [Burkholderia cenocepacia]MCW5181817.1 lytic transglycosylase domain-containing protein [Burkholderia cenocepacia]NGO98054.1 lytic transglycosylase [Burkholderia cenocepacia]
MSNVVNTLPRRATIRGVVTATLFAAGAAHADCIDDAAAFHRVNASLVRAIAIQESGMNPKSVGRNRNGSRDIGLMQINSAWIPTLARYGVTESSLFDACTNAYVGTWILAQNIARIGNSWEAVGAYNAVTPSKRAAYVQKIYRRLMAIDPAMVEQAR